MAEANISRKPDGQRRRAEGVRPVLSGSVGSCSAMDLMPAYNEADNGRHRVEEMLRPPPARELMRRLNWWS